MRGKLIAIYGVPKSGKTTQAKILVQSLKRKEYRADYFKMPNFKVYPSGSFLYDLLVKKENIYLTEHELQLWFALNRLQTQAEIKKILEEDQKHVIIEDYLGHSLAFGMLAGVSEKWLLEINHPCLQPDLSIFIDSERALLTSTGEANRTLKILRQKYLKLGNFLAWYRVQGDRKIMEVHGLIWDIVKKII
jgi:dTMP kinase